MAMWVEKSSKRKEIDAYFSSINCMSRRIIDDINDVQRKCGSSWDEMSIQDQERTINEFMVSAEVKKHYPLPDVKDYSYIFPTLRIDTGQKIMEVQTEQSESPTAWFDEFSSPFSWETKSQMDLRLPPPDVSQAHQRLNSQKSTKSEKEAKAGENTKMQETSRLDQKNKHSRKEKDSEKGRKKSTKSNKSKSSNSNGNHKTPIAVEDVNFDFNNDESEFLSLTSDLSSFKDANNKFDDDVVPEILPSSELSKAYDESEFLDLYPQKPVSKPTTREVLVASKPNATKFKKLEKKPSKDRQDATAPPSVIRQKKTHRKKQSSGTQQVNPRSSLTLDGAILNLEIAAEINKQGIDSQKSQEKNEKVFNNEEELLRQIEKETDMDDWLAKETEDVEEQTQKTGFDFLDNCFVPGSMLVGPMPSVSLKTIIFIHWCLFIWAFAGWGFAGYLYCNLSVLAIGVWAVADRQSVDALFLYILMMLCSIILDIVSLALYFPSGYSGFPMFGAVMAIINLILKPCTTILVYQMYLDRGGEYNINFGPNSTSYDNIGDDSTGSSADFRNVLQPGPTPPPHGGTGYHAVKPQPQQ